MSLRFWKKTKPENASKKNKELEETAKAIQTIIESGYSSHHRVYKVNFIRGIFFGLGSALGATAILAVLIWIISLFSEVPLIGDFIDAINNTVNT